MSKAGRDRSLDTLLELDGEVLFLDEKAEYWVRFSVTRVEPTEDKPHGLDYSLTLHGPGNERLVGFDNAHPVQPTKGLGGKSQKSQDHKHRLKTVSPYDYKDAATLGRLLGRSGPRTETERGFEMKTLKIGIASYDDMKTRTMALARGYHKRKRGEPKVWFTSIESFARILSDRNRELLALIIEAQPDSLTKLEELSGRRKSNISRTLRTMERYGLVSLKKGEGGRIMPRVPYSGIALDVPIAVMATENQNAANRTSK